MKKLRLVAGTTVYDFEVEVRTTSRVHSTPLFDGYGKLTIKERGWVSRCTKSQ